LALGQNASGAESESTAPRLLQLYDEVKETVEREWEVMRDVFPNSQDVIQTFVRRIFDQSIQSYLEMYLEKCKNASLHSFQHALSTSHAATRKLVEDLQSLDRNVISRKPGLPGGLSTTLERALEDLFIPYGDMSRFVEKDTITITKKGLVAKVKSSLNVSRGK